MCLKSHAAHNLESYQFLKDLERLVAAKGLRFINTSDTICDGKSCSMLGATGLLYRDTNHLSILGSVVVSMPIVGVVDELMSSW